VTLPTPDAQSPRFLSQQTHSTHSIHLIPTTRLNPTTPVPSSLPSASETEISATIARERATEFATHSWDLASGGLKTLTAKRELPPRLERRATKLSATPAAPRSYMFPLVILACIVIMLLSGGIVVFMMLQP
jgi:hypothetical protein